MLIQLTDTMKLQKIFQWIKSFKYFSYFCYYLYIFVFRPLPYCITGDFDSCNKELLKEYEAAVCFPISTCLCLMYLYLSILKGVKIIHDPEQVTNDLEKCFKTLLRCESGEITDNVFKAKNLIVIGALEGRFDHVCLVKLPSVILIPTYL